VQSDETIQNIRTFVVQRVNIGTSDYTFQTSNDGVKHVVIFYLGVGSRVTLDGFVLDE
jgi:hypothetical protein